MTRHLDLAREVCLEAARVGGEILREGYGRVQSIRFKGEVDIVTDVDLRAERAITELIAAKFPTHTIEAEEGSEGGADRAHRWIIDPLDGTSNYAHGVPVFAVSIGYEMEGQMTLGAVYHPSLDELFFAQMGGGATLNGAPISVSATTELRRAMLATGFPYDRALMARALAQFGALSMQCQAVRRVGSAALDLCWVAAGRFDGYWEQNVHSWDVAGGGLIAAEAGARLANAVGGPYSVDEGGILAATPGIYDALVSELRAANG
ncbi:MAG: inositol monophosphatase family protein [Chloroflexota bacterium]